MRVAQCKMVLVAAVFLLLTGCLFQPPDDLYSLPEPPVIWVGGAVVTPEHARRMGADYYAGDAPASGEIARKVLG